MITDEMLALAAAEVSCAMVDSVPEQEHRFSAKFERKMRALRRRAEHPYAFLALRRVAVLMICALTAFSLLFAASPTVRAAVVGWVRTVFEGFIQYSSPVTTPSDVRYDYRLPEEIGKFTLANTIDRGDTFFYVYFNTEGEMLIFDYTRAGTNQALFLDDVSEHKYKSVRLGAVSADVYLAPGKDEASVIIWNDPAENVLFCISAPVSEHDLIDFAKKVEKFYK